MQNFTFYNPTKIVFGKGQLAQLDTLVPQQCRVLITYGSGSVQKSGLLDKVKEELKKSGAKREIFEFGGIPANPQFSILMKAVEIVRKENIDFLLAVGGGSVMDGTKFIAVAAKPGSLLGKERELMNFGHKGVPTTNVIPLATIATLPATGSEMNHGAVISDGEDKLTVFSQKNYPQFSILDPELTYTLPSRQVANGVVDSFVHVAEQYITFPVEGRFQDRTAEGILQTLIEIGATTVNEPKNYDARANLVWNATMALNGLIGAGVPQDWTTHAIGHECTALFGIDHARTLACIMPAVWKVCRKQKQAKLLQYAERVWHLNGSLDEKISKAIACTENFFNELEVTTHLSDYGVKKSDIDKIIANMKKHGMEAISETGKLNLETSRKIIETAL